MSDELVYAVPRALLFPEPRFPGGEGWLGVRSVEDETLDLIESDGVFLPRPEAERDPGHKQIIPYLVLRDGDRFFLMKRTRAGGDARLHDLYSIGVGGHLNPGDGDVLGCLRREWQEEIEADFEPTFEFVGLLNDDTVDVGRVHLGVVFVADAAGRPVSIRETHKLSGSFEPLSRLRETYGQMETWSQLVLDHLTGTDVSASGRAKAGSVRQSPSEA